MLPEPPATLLGEDSSLFLDFDGTLVELASTPDAVVVDPRLGALLQAIAERLDGRVALISGRAAGDVAALLGGPGLGPALGIVGSHGMEFRHADGRRSMAERPAALDDVRARMQALAAQRKGLLVEDKPLGVALHYRQAPEHGGVSEALAAELAQAHGLHLQPGKMMVELRAPGGDKGFAIRTLMGEPCWASTRPLFMGDDHTDEPGFAAAVALGGAGVLIGTDRESAATYRLPDVATTRAWLEAAVA